MTAEAETTQAAGRAEPMTALVVVGTSAVFLLALAGLGNAWLSHVAMPAILKRGTVVLHLTTVFMALPLGISQLLLPKGTLRHRVVGYVWCVLMVVTALVSFTINTLTPQLPFSPIHALSVLTLVTIPGIIYNARTHRVAQHRRSVLILMAGGLVVAGFFTFLPARALGQLVFRLFGLH